MRYKEFAINIPINIRFGDDGSVDISTDDDSRDSEDQENTMVPPLQQKIELSKAGLGKDSKVIDELLDDEFLDEQEDLD
jgi:hypothetical protein